MGGYKNIQDLYENTVLSGTSSALEESRGGYLISRLEELEDTFNNDARFYNKKYADVAPDAQDPMLSQKDHKAMINALKNLSKTMQKGYKGKLIGF